MKGTPEEKAAWQREYRRKNREYVNARDAANIYGITVEQALELKRRKACDICGAHPQREGWSHAIDHCHSSGEVRGVLCMQCNQGLGKFRDSPEPLQAAIMYRIKPKLYQG